MANNYLDKREMYTAIVKHRTACEDAKLAGRPKPRVSEYLGSCFLLIAKGLGSKRNFASYTYVEDMIMDAVENCVNVVLSFNPDKYDNPHAYFTLICWRAFLRRIDREKKTLIVKHKVTENYIVHNPELDMSSGASPEDKARKSLENSYMNDLVAKYEEKDREGRVKRAEKKRVQRAKSEELEIELETSRRKRVPEGPMGHGRLSNYDGEGKS